MTVAAAVAVVAPVGREGKYGSCRETIVAAAAAAAACHRRETSVAAAAAAVACHRREASVAAAAAAAEACHRHPRPPVPKSMADDKSMGVRGFRRRTHRRPLFGNFMGLALRVDGTDGVFKFLAGQLGAGQSDCFHDTVTFRELAENDLNNIRLAFLDPDSMHHCLEAENGGKEKIGVFVPHELNSPAPPQANAAWLGEGATTTPSLSSKHPKWSDTRTEDSQRGHQQSLWKIIHTRLWSVTRASPKCPKRYASLMQLITAISGASVEIV